MNAPVASIGFTELEIGVFVVRYRTPDEMAPDRQRPLTEAILRAGATRATGVIFVVASTLRSVEMSVPNFWLEFTGRKDTGLKAMSIVTASAGVRVAVHGFALANTIRGVSLGVKHFADEAEATGWTLALVRGGG